MSNLNQRIARFYDQSTDLWLDMWGEHMHHGYYPPDGSVHDHQEAQVALIERVLDWGAIQQPKRILDAGCGVGGSARYLANKYKAEALGVNLSQVQVDRARSLTQKAGLEQRVQFQQRDLLSLSASDGPFDLIWSMENAEHIGPKQEMLQLFHDLLCPGGKMLIVTWCIRDEPGLTAKDQQLLENLYRIYNLPPMISLAEYEYVARKIGLEEVQTDDWSEVVAPFWGAVIRSALTGKGLRGLFKAGWSTMQGAWAMRYMQKGYRSGLIRFGLLQATRP